MTITSVVSVVAVCISAFSIGMAIWTSKKKEAQDDSGQMATIIYGVETIKDGVSEIKRDMRDMREEIRGIDRRVTKLETHFEDTH